MCQFVDPSHSCVSWKILNLENRNEFSEDSLAGLLHSSQISAFFLCLLELKLELFSFLAKLIPGVNLEVFLCHCQHLLKARLLDDSHVEVVTFDDEILISVHGVDIFQEINRILNDIFNFIVADVGFGLVSISLWADAVEIFRFAPSSISVSVSSIAISDILFELEKVLNKLFDVLVRVR